jgi:hydroxymethylglutaryl-CoA lyase
MATLEAIYPSDRITLREVGLRDGLQMVRSFPGATQKEEFLKSAFESGVRLFEVGSYLPEDRYPQFADVDRIAAFARSLGGRSSALALNKRGAIRALEGEVDEIMFVVSASDAHNLANANRTRAKTLAEIAEAAALAHSLGNERPLLAGAIAMSFGCSIDGRSAVSIGDVISIAADLFEAGIDIVNVADTVGYGGPQQVREIVRAFRKAFGDAPLAMHFHDTRGLGLANCAAALDEGVRILDAAIGGLGGCPFAPGATGNVVFEDLVFLAGTMGYETGIELDRLMPARQILKDAMPDELFHGQIATLGTGKP